MVNAGQSWELMGMLGKGIDWEKLGLDPQTVVEGREARNRAVEEFRLFLENGCRIEIGGLMVPVPAFDPVQILGKGHSLVVADHDVCNDGLTEIDFGRVDLVTCLEGEETSITGEVKLERLKKSGFIRYGANVGWGLWQDYQARKENSVLETLYRLRKITYLDFPGDVILTPAGDRAVLCLCRGEAGWRWSLSWLERDWDAADVSAVSRVASGT